MTEVQQNAVFKGDMLLSMPFFFYYLTQKTAKNAQLSLLSGSEILIRVLQLIPFFLLGLYKALEVGWEFLSQTHLQKKISFEMF